MNVHVMTLLIKPQPIITIPLTLHRHHIIVHLSILIIKIMVEMADSRVQVADMDHTGAAATKVVEAVVVAVAEVVRKNLLNSKRKQ